MTKKSFEFRGKPIEAPGVLVDKSPQEVIPLSRDSLDKDEKAMAVLHEMQDLNNILRHDPTFADSVGSLACTVKE